MNDDIGIEKLLRIHFVFLFNSSQKFPKKKRKKRLMEIFLSFKNASLIFIMYVVYVVTTGQVCHRITSCNLHKEAFTIVIRCDRRMAQTS